MAIRKRLILAGAVLLLASILYGAGRHHSAFLIQYVVEQSLIQKAPTGEDPSDLRARLRTILAAIPAENAKMTRLLQMSEFLEKTQSLTPEDLDKLLAPETEQPHTGPVH
jgi:hypothetical protein